MGVIQDMCLNDTHKGREAFSKIKGIPDAPESAKREALVEIITGALGTVTAQGARGRFGQHRGYYPQPNSYDRRCQ